MDRFIFTLFYIEISNVNKMLQLQYERRNEEENS